MTVVVFEVGEAKDGVGRDDARRLAMVGDGEAALSDAAHLLKRKRDRWEVFRDGLGRFEASQDGAAQILGERLRGADDNRETNVAVKDAPHGCDREPSRLATTAERLDGDLSAVKDRGLDLVDDSRLELGRRLMVEKRAAIDPTEFGEVETAGLAKRGTERWWNVADLVALGDEGGHAVGRRERLKFSVHLRRLLS